MLSAICTPFIVFWASSYNFKNVTKMLDKTQNERSCTNRLLSTYLTMLSFPVIGVIFTMIEIIGIYLLDIFEPLIYGLRLHKIKLMEFWLETAEIFKKGNSMEFFTLSELFFESIPQVILQLWIYILYPDRFIDSSGARYLTTFDIGISLGSAFLNIGMNIYQIKHRANRLGLDIGTYIPYFMGSQLDKVINRCIPIRNWLISDRYTCNISKIDSFYCSNMPNGAVTALTEHLYNSEKHARLKKCQKKIVLPIELTSLDHSKNGIENDIERERIVRLNHLLRKAMDDEICMIDFYSENPQNIYTNEVLFFISMNRKINSAYRKNLCHRKTLHVDTILNRMPADIKGKVMNQIFKMFDKNSQILKLLDEHNVEIDDFINLMLHVLMVLHLFDRTNFYMYVSRNIKYLVFLGIYSNQVMYRKVMKYLYYITDYKQEEMYELEKSFRLEDTEHFERESVLCMEKKLISRVMSILNINHSYETETKNDEMYTKYNELNSLDRQIIYIMHKHIFHTLAKKPNGVHNIYVSERKTKGYQSCIKIKMPEKKQSTPTCKYIELTVQFCRRRSAYAIHKFQREKVESESDSFRDYYYAIEMDRYNTLSVTTTNHFDKASTWLFIPSDIDSTHWYILSSCRHYVLVPKQTIGGIVFRLMRRKKYIQDMPPHSHVVIENTDKISLEDIKVVGS